MLLTVVYFLLCLWCIVYTISYGVFEYKRKNPTGAYGIFALCALLTLAAVGTMVSVY